jgi:phosphoesterase RecJ-like protein
MSVRRRDLLETGCNVDDVEGFVHHTLSIAGVRAGILFVEVDGEIKCSFRSKGDTGVRDLAAKFGGGGHVHAAGARIRQKSFEEAVPMVTAAAIEMFKGLTPHALDNGQ